MSELRTSTRTIFPSVARTATPAAVEFDDGTAPRNGGYILINVSAIGAAPSVVFNIEGLAPVAGFWYPILTSVAITATGATLLRIFPGATPGANTAVSDWLPPRWRVRPVHGNADSITYSVEALLR